MMRLLRLALAIAMLGLAACTMVEQGMMSGTRMDLRDYRQKTVGILDVAVNPSYSAAQLPLTEIANSIATALEKDLSIKTQRVALDTSALAFPLTPQRMADAASNSGLQAVIGASIIAWSPPSSSHRARISLIISFVDLEDSNKKWMMSGTWKATQLQEVPASIDTGLGMQFLDLEYWLRAGLIPWFADQGGPEDPVLTYYSPSESLATKNNSTSDKFLPLIVSSIDDGGLQNLTVTNRAGRFEWQPPEQLMLKAPVYVSSQVSVPLQFGSNTVMVNAIDIAGHRTERKIMIDSTARRGLNVLGVGIDEDDSGMEADEADDAIRKLERSASALNVPKPVILKDKNATTERVFAALQETRKNLGQGDELLIVLTGRGGISSRDPYLELYRDQPSRTPAGLRGFEDDSSAQRLRLNEVLEFAADYPALIVLDLCTDSAAVDYVRMSLNGLLKTLSTPFATEHMKILADISDCEDGVGVLTKQVADHLAAIRKPSERTTERLFALTHGDNESYLAWTWEEPGLRLVSPPSEGFWAVAMSTLYRDEALDQARQLKARGASTNVVLGTNGLFNITLGNFETKDQALIEIKNAASKGWLIDDTAYVLAPERVKQIEPARVP